MEKDTKLPVDGPWKTSSGIYKAFPALSYVIQLGKLLLVLVELVNVKELPLNVK